MPKRTINLRWPMGGLNKRRSFREQPPYTTRNCRNVRPDGTIKGVERGGSRPGLGKAYYDLLGSGNPVRMLAEVTHVEDGGFFHHIDEFNGDSLSPNWTLPSWLADLPSVQDNLIFPTSGDEEVGAVLAAQSIDSGEAYQIDLLILPQGGTHNGEFRIYARMDDSTPDVTADGIEANLILDGATGAYSGTLKSYVSSTPTTTTFSTGNHTSAQSGIFRVHISGTTVTCSWLGTQVASATVGAHAGVRTGFGMKAVTAGTISAVGYFHLQYKKSGSTRKARRKRLVASANGTLYREGLHGVLDSVSSNLSIGSDRRINAINRGQLLYIADYGDPRAEGTSGVIAGAGNDELDDVGVADWSTLSISAYDDVAVISGVSGGTVAGTYQISSVASGEVTLSSAPGAGNCTYSIQRAPKIYDPSANTLTLWTATSGKGQVPSGCSLVARYRDRLVLAGDQATPHAWYMSRQGDPHDWDYSGDASDVQRAVAGASSEAGLIGEPINALIPHSDDYLLIGCDHSIWVLRGDPAFGGQIDNVSHAIGIVDSGSWCEEPEGAKIFLSQDGIYILAQGAQGYPQSISKGPLPNELQDIDTSTHQVSMAYDVRDRGVHVYLTPNVGGGEGIHYWFDWETKSWWPYTFSSSYEPTAILRYRSDLQKDSHVIVGCRDGYVRRYFDENDRDESTTFDSYIEYGPFALVGNDFHDGVVMDLVGTLGAGSNDVTWSMKVGNSAEAAVSATAQSTATWSAGRNGRVIPRARGLACVLRLEDASNSRWAVEGVSAKVKTAGRQRVY